MLEGIKSILVAMTEEGRDEPIAALRYGQALALEAGAHLTVLASAHRIDVPHALVGRFGRDLVSSENRRVKDLADRLAERTKHEADLAGIICSVESPQLRYNDMLSRFVGHARVNDVVIVDAEKQTIDIDRGLIETAVFESGRPVMIVHADAAPFSAKRAVIAWDGSMSATRAVAGAMPFLRQAEHVTIVSVMGEKDLTNSVSGADLARYLARHGIAVTVGNTTLKDKETVAQALLRQSRTATADLLVVGAYRHSRLREWLLGGVTQSLLKDSSLPMLMSH